MLLSMMDYSDGGSQIPKKHPFSHYYGDDVRRLFLLASVGILLGVLFYQDLLPFASQVFVMGGVLLLALFAGLVNPLEHKFIKVDLALSAVGFLLFEYAAATGTDTSSIPESVIRQALALIFLFAFYFATKSLRTSKP